MNSPLFHHPDFCPVVLRRRAAEELLEILLGLADMVLAPGRQVVRGPFASDGSYRNAICRLRRQGLIAYRREGGRQPVLMLTREGLKKTSPVCRRKEPWPEDWHGRWYLLTYDVPESERRYRNVLRRFLESKRMGLLHRSVWITHHDIRADFDDLVKAGGLDNYAFLFESRSVLGRPAREIVATAWDMDRIKQIQEWFIGDCRGAIERAKAEKPSPDAARQMMCDELAAFKAAMEEDPLLPSELWPDGYAGERAWRLHHDFTHVMSGFL